jgi:partner of Y14 and mago protein
MAQADQVQPQTTRSGIRKLSNGESIIPASTRPDGSLRKEIRVKPGYKPPEDVEVYKNRTAQAWKNRGKGGVPGAAAVEEDDKLPPHKAAAAAAKNAKRREARKKAAAGTTDGQENVSVTPQTDDKPATTPEETDPEVEKAKEARKLAKKLRQARELKDKKDKGDNLLPEQFEKVIKMNELMRQLEKLGFDADGERKKPDGVDEKQETAD